MKRLISIAVVIFLVLVVGGMPSFGKSNVEFMDLYEQDSLGRINWNGAWGKLKFNLVGPTFKFIFNGHSLDPDTSYTLIRSREPEIKVPNRFETIANGTADQYGNLYIAGEYQFHMSLISANFLLIPTADAVPDKPLQYLSKYLFSFAPISYEDTTTELKCGDNQSPGPPIPGGPPNWDILGFQIGDKAVDFTLFGIEGPGSLTPGNQPQPLQEFTLSNLLLQKPVVLTFGGFTWNPYRQRVAATETLKATYGDSVHFITVYVIDPHPNGSRSPYNKGGTGWQEWWANYPTSIDKGPTEDPLFQPRTYKERVAQARSMMRQLGVTTPVLIDEMDNPVWVTYGKMPNCAYLIGQDGTVIERESWYQPTQLEAAIKAYLGIPWGSYFAVDGWAAIRVDSNSGFFLAPLAIITGHLREQMASVK